MKRIFLLIVMAMAMVVGLSAQGHALLQDRGTDNGYHLIYDDDLNITWYDFSKSFDTWQSQVNWADTLSITFNGTTYDNWRLPRTFGQICYGYNCTNSEMGHLYYTELGNSAGLGGFTNTGPFQDLQAYDYWSGTEFFDYAWGFGFDDGGQGIDVKGSSAYALAVRPGDVVSAPVPEPATMLLLATGLAGLGVYRKRIGRRRG